MEGAERVLKGAQTTPPPSLSVLSLFSLFPHLAVQREGVLLLLGEQRLYFLDPPQVLLLRPYEHITRPLLRPHRLPSRDPGPANPVLEVRAGVAAVAEGEGVLGSSRDDDHVVMGVALLEGLDRGMPRVVRRGVLLQERLVALDPQRLVITHGRKRGGELGSDLV